MSTDDLDLAELRRIAEAATPGPWEAVTSEATMNDASEYRIGDRARPQVLRATMPWADANHIATFDPLTVLALIDRIRSLEAERDGIRRRDEEVGTDEGWWIGGAWGDYGEAVVPLRILSYVIDGALDQKVESIDPGFALTYAEQVARADRAEARLARVTDNSMANRIHDRLADNGADILPGDARAVLNLVRAVAAGEQTERRHYSDSLREGGEYDGPGWELAGPTPGGIPGLTDDEARAYLAVIEKYKRAQEQGDAA